MTTEAHRSWAATNATTTAFEYIEDGDTDTVVHSTHSTSCKYVVFSIWGHHLLILFVLLFGNTR